MRVRQAVLVVGTLAVVGGATACGPLPQTRSEFALYGEEGRGEVVKQTRSVAVPFGRVVELLKEKTRRCLNIGFTEGRLPVNYLSALEVRGPGRAELTVQRHIQGMAQKVPDDGYYVFTADLRAAGNRILVVTHRYRYTMFQELNETIDLWLEGKAVGCPQMP